MKNIYMTPDVLILHVDTEGIVCGSFAGRIDSVDEGMDYGDL